MRREQRKATVVSEWGSSGAEECLTSPPPLLATSLSPPSPLFYPLCFLRPDRRQHTGRKGEERRQLLQSGAAEELTTMRERGETWGENFDTRAAVR